MLLVKILKRRDASSVVVAIVVGFVLFTMLSSVTATWSDRLLNTGSYHMGADWKTAYLAPILTAFFELVLLELLGWIYVWFTAGFKKK